MTRFTLDIPLDLNDWLKDQAKRHNRSKNQHINYLLQSIRQTAEENQERLSRISEIDGLTGLAKFMANEVD
jgi:hypothetical protein